MSVGVSLKKNTVWNLAGQGIPLLVGLWAIPVLVRGLGVARFGVLTLAWALIGYSSLFDLGLSRALIKLVAEKIGDGDIDGMSRLVWTSIVLMLATGLVGGIAFAFIDPWLVRNGLKIAPELQHEALISFFEIAFSIPLVVISAGFRGVLEAQQLFSLVNAIRIPLGVLTFIAPIATLYFSNSLVFIVLSLVVSRAIGLFFQAAFALWSVPEMKHGICCQRSLLKPLLTFGGWMTISNVIGPIMVYADRFMIGALLSMSAVAFYSTPVEVATKLWLVPAAVMGVLFPAFSSLLREQDRLIHLYSRGANCIFAMLLPPCIVMVAFAHSAMHLWLGESFASSSAIVLEIVLAGVFINSIAQIPFGFVQAAGRPDLTAKLHLLELPAYVLMAWFLIRRFGLPGAAVAWTCRLGVELIVLSLFVNKLLPQGKRALLRVLLMAISGLGLLVAPMLISNQLAKVIYVLCVMAVFAAFVRKLFPNGRRNQLVTKSAEPLHEAV